MSLQCDVSSQLTFLSYNWSRVIVEGGLWLLTRWRWWGCIKDGIRALLIPTSHPSLVISRQIPVLVTSCPQLRPQLGLELRSHQSGTSSNLYNMETTNFGQRVRVRGNAEWVVMLWYSGINRVWRHGSPVHLSKLSIPIVIFNFSFKLPEPNF